jgi:tRNA (guanine-N7-)-methyltransferase
MVLEITEKDLKIPFGWEERRPIWLGPLFYMPAVYKYKKEPWNWSEIFGNTNPVSIEYCSGNGQWIAERAKQNPHINWVAVEKRFDRSRKIWLKIQREEVSNLIVVCGEAYEFTRYFCPPKSVQEIFVNFPDPWPKLRHAKHRLIQSEFLTELLEVIPSSGKAICVTDDAKYASQIVSVFRQISSWNLLFHAQEWPDYGPSFFADLWKGKGRTIHYLSFEVQ